jgi:hypothetical protein
MVVDLPNRNTLHCRWKSRNRTQYRSGEHLQHLFGAPCFDPVKDVCVPGYKPMYTYKDSPLLGTPAVKRDILLFLRGDVGKHRLRGYSNGVRQALYKHAVEHDWAGRHGILIGDSADIKGGYSSLLARSKYCVVATGILQLPSPVLGL